MPAKRPHLRARMRPQSRAQAYRKPPRVIATEGGINSNLYLRHSHLSPCASARTHTARQHFGKHTANIVKGKGADTPAHSREIITLNEGRKATPYD